MEAWLQSSIHWLLLTLALPRFGLSAIFIVSLVSATLLPLGSEPAVFGFVKISPHMFWPAVLVATLGNTIGGSISSGMGLGAEKAYERWRETHTHKTRHKAGCRSQHQESNSLPRLGHTALLVSRLTSIRAPLS